MMVIMIVIIRPLGHGVQIIYFSLPVFMFYKHMKVLLKRFWVFFFYPIWQSRLVGGRDTLETTHDSALCPFGGLQVSKDK